MEPSAEIFHVFLSHNSQDKPAVRELKRHLQARQINAWLDEEHLTPGRPWQDELENIIQTCQTAAVLVGANGLGPWEAPEMRACLSEFVERNLPVIPVLLPGAPSKPQLPLLLRGFTWVDLRGGFTPAGLDRLQQGITRAPAATNAPPAEPPVPSSLPRQPYFFGRHKELGIIEQAINPQTRSWGALIDGPGGIGKTALAIEAGHRAPAGWFAQKIFLSAKIRELTAEGERPLDDFMQAGYQDMLKALAKELGDNVDALNPAERPQTVRAALQGRRALLVIDNLETLPEAERGQLYLFLGRLPEGCKAIVTSRRRNDIDARVIRLDRLDWEDAHELLRTLGQSNPLLAQAGEAGWRELYQYSHGNPLLLRWLAGQLGRAGSRCRTVKEACAYLEAAPPGNDPLDYVFGDLLDTFTDGETAVLAALSHFSLPARVEWIATVAGVARPVAETALQDLANRALLLEDEAGETYLLPPLAAAFLRKRRPEAVQTAGQQLLQHATALALQYGGYDNFDGHRQLEQHWPSLAAALPLWPQGDNGRLQEVYDALRKFLDFSGRWDEWLELSRQAERAALAAGDHDKAGWRAYDAGCVHHLRRQGEEVLACAQRCAEHWRQAQAGTREQAIAIQLRGIGHELQKDSTAARQACDEALALHRAHAPRSRDVAISLNYLADVMRRQGDYPAAASHYREALRLAEENGWQESQESIAICTSNLAALALDQGDAVQAEALAWRALSLAKAVNRQEMIGAICRLLAKALARQGRAEEGLPHAQRAVDVFARLRQPENLAAAQAALRECGGAA